MSHFTVMVIGENPEEQLAPYDENESVEPYLESIVSQEEKDRFVAYYTEKGENSANKGFEELYVIFGEDWNGKNWVRNEVTGEWEEYSTYNPKSKWDWYQLGGRWNGFLKLKDGAKGEVGSPSLISSVRADAGWADRALKSQIDFEGMRDVAGKQAVEEYNKVKEVFGGVIPKLEHSWSTIIDPNNPFFSTMSIDEKREFYHNQDAMKLVKKLQKEEKLEGFFFDLDHYQVTVEEYEQKARKNAILTFAVVKDSEWYERGTMGWWAIVADEKDNWDDEFNKLIDSVSDDTLISVYDCHI